MDVITANRFAKWRDKLIFGADTPARSANMDVVDLRVFEVVARHGSMNRAAAELHTVQSNVTVRIRSLERDVGVPLFLRHTHGVSMTTAGQRLLPFSARIAKMVSDARLAARDDGTPGGTLTLGTLETTAALRLPPILRNFADAHPQVKLSLTTGTTCGLTADVAECRLDGAFVAGPVNHPELEAESIFREELVLVTPRPMRSLEQIDSMPDLKIIVFRLGCSYRRRLESLLVEMGMQTATPLEFASIDAIVACVGAGIGVTLLPRGIVSAAARSGQVKLHALSPDNAQVDSVFIRRRDAFMTSAMRAFLAAARCQFEPVSVAA